MIINNKLEISCNLDSIDVDNTTYASPRFMLLAGFKRKRSFGIFETSFLVIEFIFIYKWF